MFVRKDGTRVEEKPIGEMKERVEKKFKTERELVVLLKYG
jgi:hypothetical protein